MMMVFAGRQLGPKGKVYNTFHVIDDDGELGEERHYARNSSAVRGTALASPKVGGVYEVEADGTTITPATSRFVRALGDEDKVARWQAADEATRIELSRRRAEKRYADDLPLQRAVTRMQDAYRRVAPSQRAGLLAHIIREVTR